MKNFFTLIALAFSSFMLGQIGIGTPTPRGELDLNRPLTNTFGLVLPTNASTANILNPQGGTVADGTMIYDSAMKCVKVYTGNTWSDCLADALPPTVLTANCTTIGFQGTFISGKPLSGQTFQVTITNNGLTTVGPIHFQNSDLVLSGVSGLTVSSVSPASSTINSGQSIIVTYNLSGTPALDGMLTGSWSKLNLNCTSTVQVGIGVRVAYWNVSGIGGNNSAREFNLQLEDPANYGFNGTYSGNFSGFIFTDITNTLGGLSDAQLSNDYDIISTGFNREMSVADAAKIKAFVDRGGVTIVVMNHNVGTNLFNAFGGTGSVTFGVSNTVVTNNNINKGTFGNAVNFTLTAGAGSHGSVRTGQLPPGAVLLASRSGFPDVFLVGNGGRAIFIWSESVFRSNVNGTIDNPQEVFLHNVMAYALHQAGY